MSLGSSLVLYAMIGAGVAAANCLRRDSTGTPRLFHTTCSLMFWPFYLPLLLDPADSSDHDAEEESHDEAGSEVDLAIERVEGELDRALQTLDGWAEDALAVDTIRLEELKTVWRVQAARIEELNQLLKTTDFNQSALSGGAASPAWAQESAKCERIRQSEQSRQANIKRLLELRDRMQTDLTGTLAWVRELVTMIHLAKYTGAPASRAEELVAQIAAAVEGLSEVSDWPYEV